MDYVIQYFSHEVQQEILALPDTLAARYVVLTRRMVAVGPHLGEPHTKDSVKRIGFGDDANEESQT